jgi:RNA polymerase sigma factor (sigma-70 family)
VTDEQLAIRVKAGDEPAFRALAVRARPVIAKLARSRWAPGHDLADLEQEGLIALHEAATVFSGAAGVPFMAFANLVIRRRFDELLKHEMRLKRKLHSIAVSLDAPLAGDDVTLRDVVAGGCDPADVIDESEVVRAVVAAARTRLSPLEREALIGFVFSGESYLEIEGRLGIANDGSPKKVDNALQRARVKIAEELQFPVPLGVAA